MRRLVAFGLLAVSSATLLGACSKSGQLEDEVAKLLKDDANEELIVQATGVDASALDDVQVDCPGDVDAKDGDEVTCGATIGGDEFDVDITFVDDNEFEITNITPA
jgi:hypothetical protein